MARSALPLRSSKKAALNGCCYTWTSKLTVYGSNSVVVLLLRLPGRNVFEAVHIITSPDLHLQVRAGLVLDAVIVKKLRQDLEV